MIHHTQSIKLIQSDGTSQQDRHQRALEHDYVQIEDRTIEDLILEAQDLALEIRFFDENEQSSTNWEGLFIDDLQDYLSKTETEKEIQRQKWAKELAEFGEAPERFQSDQRRLSQLSRPQVALFLTFLKLLSLIKDQINGLTRKHLDFYFLQQLRATPKDAIPDVVNVLLDLATDQDQFELKKGTIFSAGKDRDGNDLLYSADRDTVISTAKVGQIKNVFVEKSKLTIREAHLNNLDDQDKGFTKMMEFALGRPKPGDPLPPFPDGVGDWEFLKESLENGNAESVSYVSNQLHFSPNAGFRDFHFVVATHLKDLEPNQSVPTEEWTEVYQILDQAYKNQVRKQRQEALKELKESDPVNGFELLIRHTFGVPDPGDDLPLYRGNPADLIKVHQDLITPDPTEGDPQAVQQAREAAEEYVEQDLFLSTRDFVNLMQVSSNPSATDEKWKEVYKSLELANRKLRSIQLPSPSLEVIYAIHGEENPKEMGYRPYGEESESLRFKTFGGHHAHADHPLKPANIGLAISSPNLQLSEGKRSITVNMSLQTEDDQSALLAELFNHSNNDLPPFKVALSSGDRWLEPQAVQFIFGDLIVGEPLELLDGTLDGEEFNLTSGPAFRSLDEGKYIVWSDGRIFEVIQVLSEDRSKVKRVGVVAGQQQIKKYNHVDIYLNALSIQIVLETTDPEVSPLTLEAPAPYIDSPHPLLLLSLNHEVTEEAGQQRFFSHYDAFNEIQVQRVGLKVEVQGIKTAYFQNDQSSLDPKKPFEPFGETPEVGSGFYMANPEICQKRLDQLEIQPQWMNLPANLQEHYGNYWKIENGNPDLPEEAYRVQSNQDFKAKLFLNNGRTEIPLTTVDLFSESGTIEIDSIPEIIKAEAPAFNYQLQPEGTVSEEVLESDRYFKLELQPHDFFHQVYDGLFRKQALFDGTEEDIAKIKRLDIKNPYTPKLKSLQLGYTTREEISLDRAEGKDFLQLFHLHPFGYAPLDQDSPQIMVPQYQDEGEFYLGIEALETPQTLSLLFQMSEGSADPDVATPTLQWNYLQDNRWQLFPDVAIISDSSNGLLNSGIVHLNIPSEATRGDSLMPGNYHWLKISCPNRISGIPDTIDVVTQAVSATFASEQVAASHFSELLPAETITETQNFIPEIRTITQPYTSSKGRPAESSETFYNRISERIRHKNRALTMWDYERLVLEEFPEVFRVKCLPAVFSQSRDELGAVNVVVIPDIKGKIPFNPFEPKVPASTLFQIQQYLEYHTPSFANVVVRNPTFIQIKVRCVVKFKPGYNEGFYKPRLNEEITRFLAPWAYSDGGDITIGGTVYASGIINFIAERPYIDYVANVKLFQSQDGVKFIDVRTLTDGQNSFTSSRPDAVLVSAQIHELDIVDEKGYDEESFEGINYMKVELDFQVGEDILPQSEQI